VKNIIAHPQTFRARLPLIGNHPFFETVTLERDMDVAVIARLAEINEADFRALNPSLKQPVVMAAGTPTILLPWDNATLFESRLKTHTGALATWTAWVVPGTMTAAQAAQRVGMSESELRSVNNIPPRMLVRAGSSLLVPRSANVNRDVSLQVADNGFLNLEPEVVLRRKAVRARKGDNLTLLAKRYGLSAASVAQWNKLPLNATLKPGQSITLMLSQRVAATPATRTRSAAKVSPRPQASTSKKNQTRASATARSSQPHKGGAQVHSSKRLQKP